MRRYRGQKNGNRIDPSQKLRSTKLSEFSGAKVKGIAVDGVFLGDPESHSESDYNEASSDLIQTYNGIMMPQGGQVWPSSVGIAAVTVGSGETVALTASEIYNNAESAVAPTFLGALIIYDIQAYQVSGASRLDVYFTSGTGGDGVSNGTGFSSSRYYWFCKSLTISAGVPTTCMNLIRAGGDIVMNGIDSLGIIEGASNDTTVFIRYGVLSYGGGSA